MFNVEDAKSISAIESKTLLVDLLVGAWQT